MLDKNIAKQTKANVWDIPQTAKEGMRVPARMFASEKLMNDMDNAVFDQLTNVACLPGIVKHALCMPDGHSGYGFPIGGVAAFDPDKDGVISPGGIGFDINCGMRLVTTTLTEKDVQPRIKKLIDTLFNRVPAGVGSKGFLKLTPGQFKDVMRAGSKWCIEQGYGWDEDLAHTEDSGCVSWANPDKVTDRAIQRGITQLGTLGSGNHYLEVQVAKNIFDAKTAKQFGITSNDQICVMVHCGSRGFGHQVASDYLQVFHDKMKDYGITVRDPELSCAPFRSKEGQDYFAAMACAANAAFANRQVILHRIRECFQKVFNTPADDLGMHQVYDVAHNIAKVEEHRVDGKKKKLVVHRKGATRCFGPGRRELGSAFRDIGQPVIVGGSMETGSYLLLGTEKALEETWGSTAHGAGRAMSRTKARQLVRGEQLQKAMEKKGIYVKTASLTGLAEEAGIAYKPVSEVVDVMHKLGISKKIVGFTPLGNVKGTATLSWMLIAVPLLLAASATLLL